MNGARRVLGGALAAAAIAAAPAGLRAQAATGVSGSVGMSFDSFRERYSIVDADTLDSITEFRSRLRLAWARGSFFDDLARIEGRAAFGENALDWSGHLALVERLGSGFSRMGLDAELSGRDYRNDSSYDYANDFTRIYARAYGRWNVAPGAAIRVTDRIEVLDYARRTEFDYDYVRNTIALDGEFNWDITSVADVGVGFTTMSIPDSSEIAYHAWSPTLQLRLNPEPYRRLVVYADIERRLYAHEPARSSFWSLYSNFTGEHALAGKWSAQASGRVERYTYDHPDDIYFDFTEARGALLVKYNPDWNISVGAGPALGTFASSESPDDEYDEFGGRIVLEFARGGRAWLTASYEIGRRSYDAYSEDETDIGSIYSDYGYHRAYLLALFTLTRGLDLSTLLDYQPEDHDREGDDATATLFSIGLTYSF